MNLAQFVLTMRDICVTVAGTTYSKNRDRAVTKARVGLGRAAQRSVEKIVEKLFGNVENSITQKLDEVTHWLEESPVLYADWAAKDGRSPYPPSPDQQALAIRLMLSAGGLPDAIQAELAAISDDPAVMRYLIACVEKRAIRNPSTIVFPALLPSLISQLEDFIAGLVRLALFVHPHAMGLQDVQFSISDLSRYKAPEISLRMAAIDRKARSVLDGNPDQWRRQLNQWPGLDLANMVDSWDKLVENILRRHAVVHASSLADAKYLEHLPQDIPSPALGERLVVTDDYLHEAMNRVECLAAVLSLRWSRKLISTLDPNPMFATMAYSAALDREDWLVSKIITDALLEICSNTESVSLYRVNNWMSRLQLSNDNEKAEILKEVSDWSPPAGDKEFELARLLLLEHDSEACDLLEREFKYAGLDLSSLASWPLVKLLTKRSQRASRLFFTSRAQRPIRPGKGTRRR